MKKYLILCFFLVPTLNIVSAQTQGSVLVQVKNARNNRGKMFISIYKKEHFLDTGIPPFRGIVVLVNGNATEGTIANLDAGDYGVAIYHDENDNGQMDFSFLGFPTEGYGFSNNVHPRFSAPSFASCRISVSAGSTKTVAISLVY